MDAIEAGKHQALFREVNERVRDVNETLEHVEGEALFLCECAKQDCTERVTMSLDAYEEIRRVPTHFIVAAGHEHVFPDAERLFETHNGFWVVEKFGEAGLAAVKLDPRGRNGQGDLYGGN